MLIICVIFVYILIATFSYLITRAICNARRERKNREFANLPDKVLLQHALLNPIYGSQYHNMLMIMDEDKANDVIIRRMLLDMGLIAYRKGGS